MVRIVSLKGRSVRWALTLWLVAEIVTYVLVLDRIGLAGALLIGLGSMCIGFAMLRHVGMRAVSNLRRGLGSQGSTQANVLDGSLSALGAVLLILPGFLSDLAGLSLAAPSIRQWIGRRLGAVAQTRPKGSSASTIDLNPTDWHAVEDPSARSDSRVTRSVS